MLTKPKFEAARRFIETTARPLEVPRFRHEFQDGPREAVFAALEEYQNSDGGFGHALEPDFRADQSSVLGTFTAFEMFQSLRATTQDRVVARGIGYLLNTFDRQEVHWRLIPRGVDDSPHAPWWNDNDAFDRFSLNPTAAVLGYLYDYREKVPEEILTLVSNRVTEHLAHLEKIGMHDLLCCLSLLKSRNLPNAIRGEIRPKLASLIDGAIAWDPGEWKGYALRPLQVVDTPDSPFLAGRENAVAANLDYEIAEQNDDGSWTPNWSWDDRFPAAWEKARFEWAGAITLTKLMLFRNFGRIEL